MITLAKERSGDIAVAFRYNPELVDKVKRVPGRRWNPERKLWTVPVASLPALVKVFGDNYTVAGELPELDLLQKTVDVTAIPTTPVEKFTFKTNPFDHQIVGWNFGITRNIMLLADDQGLGKTKQVIDIAEHRANKGEVKRVLIVAKATLKYNWAQEIGIHGNRDAVVVDGKNPAEKLERFRQAIESGTFYIIINYEQMRVVKAVQKALKEGKRVTDSDILGLEIGQTDWDMVVLDESHKVKNRKSRMGEAIHDLDAPFKYALTGTPIINRPEECFNLLKWFGMERRGYWSFVKEYCVLGGFSGWEIEEYKEGAVKKISDNLRSVMLRRLKKDALDIPEKMRRTVWVDMEPAQRRVYNTILKELKTELLDKDGNPVGGTMIALTKILRLKQAAGSLELLGGKPVSAKIATTRELVEEMVEAGQKVLVFTQFLGMYKALKRELAEYGVVGIDGSMKPEDRMEAVNRFQNDAGTQVFVGMAPACREGLTLTAAQNVIFVDLEWAPAYVAQAEDRAHRIGQKNQVLITKVLCKNSIDEAIEKLLAEKQSVFDAVVEGEGAEDMAGSLIATLLAA